ncbi:MAG: hypothetical protein PUB15_09245 [Ruminobacter sp.]|nr:hypothetical protein [Ruminobacter sp.]
MWIRVATSQDAVQFNGAYTFFEGENVEKFYFEDDTSKKLEEDGFLEEMWEKFDALFDWGDCDFFDSQKCSKFREWLIEKLNSNYDKSLTPIYLKMLDFAEKAIKFNTGIVFDF